MEKEENKKSVWESKILSSKIKSGNVTLIPEALFGYLGGPFFALVPNAIINAYLTQYWKNVLGLADWASAFTWLLPLLSAILIVVGNLIVGRLMEGKPKKAGKARPLLILAFPIIVLALISLFLAPVPARDATGVYTFNILTLILVAIGYNLYYAIAWPMYYTSHSGMVNLSTRNSSQRSLLGTAQMGAQVAAAGVASMIFGFFSDWLGLLPSESNEKFWLKDIAGNPIKDAEGNVLVNYELLNSARQTANANWKIFMIVLIALSVIGILLEFLFTRERVTEEQFALMDKEDGTEVPVRKATMKEQIKICVHDKYWWFIIAFFFLYQLGGMLKNNGQMFYSEAWTGGQSLSSVIGIVGAIPTAVGMVLITPLANKFGKANCIKIGAVLAFVLGFVGLIPLFMPQILEGASADIIGLVTGTSLAGFILKSIGTVPAMYVSVALMSDVLDHQEAVYGIRTDGFTMSLYGSIMIAMSGISQAIILGITNPIKNNPVAYRTATTFIFFGGEMICYLLIAIMFLFMKVERFSNLDHETILAKQKAEAAARGEEWIEPAERERIEQEKAKEDSRIAALNELQAKCAKKGLDFEAEKALFEKNEAEKAAADEAKRKQNEEKAALKRQAKEEAARKKLEAMTPEQRAALEEKAKAKAEAKAKRDAAIRAEYEEILAKHQQSL